MTRWAEPPVGPSGGTMSAVLPGSASYSPAMGGLAQSKGGRNFAYNPPKEAEQSVKGRGLRMRR